MRYAILLVSILVGLASTAVAAAPTTSEFNVRDHGATGDGKTLDTDAINKAIDAAAANGGGTVRFPAGDYLSYSIHLKSHVALYLDAGSTIIAADPAPDLSVGYDPPEPIDPEADFYQDFGHSHWHNSLIWGEDVEDISITGPGTIYGRGLSRASGLRAKTVEEQAQRSAAGGKGPNPVPPLPDEAKAAIAAQGKGPFGYPGRELAPCRRRQQGHRPQELPQRHLPRLHHLPRRPLRHPRHRRAELDRRQPQDRHQTATASISTPVRTSASPTRPSTRPQTTPSASRRLTAWAAR